MNRRELIQRNPLVDRAVHGALLMPETPTILPLARVTSAVVPRPPHDTLVAAFEAAASTRAPFVTFHTADGAVEGDARAAFDRARVWASLLRRRGVARGDRVPILLPSGHIFVEAMLGAMLAGAVPVPLATPMTFGSMDRYLVNLAAIIADAGARVTITYARVRDALAKDEHAHRTIHDLVTADDLVGLGPMSAPLPSISGSDTAFIQYTSGTTGRPKGVVISHRAIVSNAFAIAHGLDLCDGDIGASWLPLYHDMGLIGVLLTSICHPYPVHVMSPESFVMRPRRWPELIASVGATISAAPNFAYELCAARAGDVADLRLERWRHALNGAEPVHATTARRFADRFAPGGFRADAMMPVYGMAEATLAVTFPESTSKMETFDVDRDALERDGVARAPSGGVEREAVSVGRPVAGMRVEIGAGEGRVLREREVGEIHIAGPSLMDGYFRNDDASAQAICGGLLSTGDLGFIDGGRLFITGRAKDLIIKGGRNLYPYDVERIAGGIEGVRGVAAFGRPNAETGTDDLVVVAETVYKDEERRAGIAKALRGELLAVLGVKADAVLTCAVGGVPRTSSGKIRRAECARLFAGPVTGQR